MNQPASQAAPDPLIHIDPQLVSMPGRVQAAQPLVFEPERAHDKFRSSGLFVSGPWTDVDPADPRVTDEPMRHPSDGVGVLPFSAQLVERLTEWADRGGFTGAPEPLDVDLRRDLTHEVDAASVLPGPVSVEQLAVTLRSDPSAGTSSGLTTNGLHFDDPLPGSIRIGINLGPVDRHVYVVLRRRHQIPEAGACDESGNGYGPLAEAGLRAVSIRVRAGEGWAMPTTQLLHDGRRAQPVGLSRFMLAIGRLDV